MRAFVSAIGLAVALAFASLVAAQPALAQTPIDGYCAQISEQDKLASDGYPLTDAAAILRQDRANYHRFGVADEHDYPDRSFTSSKARERIPALLDAGEIEWGLADAIVDDYPYVCVDIYADFITVYLGNDPVYDDTSSANSGDYPFIGTWDCEVAVMRFTATSYNNGGDDLPIQELQEGSDGSWTLLFEDDYWITLSGFTGSEMGWFSGASGDSFSCIRLD